MNTHSHPAGRIRSLAIRGGGGDEAKAYDKLRRLLHAAASQETPEVILRKIYLANKSVEPR